MNVDVQFIRDSPGDPAKALQDRPGGDEGATPCLAGLLAFLPSRAVDSLGWRSQTATVVQYLSNPLLDCLSPKPDRSADLYVGNLWSSQSARVLVDPRRGHANQHGQLFHGQKRVGPAVPRLTIGGHRLRD